MHTIVTMKFGSHLYGTSTPASDTDYKGVYIPEAWDILLGSYQDVIQSNSKLDTSVKNGAGDIDREVFSLRKFLALVSEGQTVTIDMLFAPESALVGSTSYKWHDIQANRDKLLSSQYNSFVGYCRQQANKYGIKGSRVAAAKAAVDLLSGYALNASSIRLGDISRTVEGALSGMEHIEFIDKPTPGGGTIRHLSVCNRMAPYTASVKNAYDTFKRIYDEYGERAKQAERNENVDWKAMSHAVRIGEQAVELLTTGFVTFPRPNAAHLVAIKTGQMKYASVADRVEELLEEVEKAAANSVLPAKPDHEWIDNFIVETHAAKVSSMRYEQNSLD